MHYHCQKHGIVEGLICRICLTENYLYQVKEGIIEPEILSAGKAQSSLDLTPLQIRYRAFVVRINRESRTKSERWKDTTRIVRSFSLGHLEDL